jgi:nicotinate-nucleotide adenylyltransferase
MRLGIYGGSFDPVHNAHLALARACQQHAALDEVWFTPAGIQPLKHHGPQAGGDERVDMLRLAIEGQPTWRVCTMEIDRGGLSYTVETLRQLSEELPDAALFFLMGADALHDVPKWREPDVMFSLATPLVVRRAGQAEPDLSSLSPLCSAGHQPQHVEFAELDISSSEIRRRVAAGDPIGHLVPADVCEYIEHRRLYR